MLNEQVGKGVVLAAGLGSRMRSLTQQQPKALLPVQGQPLIHYPIRALASAGIRDIAVVVGYKAEMVKNALRDVESPDLSITYIYNPYFHKGNAMSVLIARDWLQREPFVLCMGDHVIEEGLVNRLLAVPTIQDTLCVDSAPEYCPDVNEATKVQTNSSGLIVRIGKGLHLWNAIDTGVFLLTRAFIETTAKLISMTNMNIGISEVIQAMITSGRRFATRDVTGLYWADMDTQEDLYYTTSGRRKWGLDMMASSPER